MSVSAQVKIRFQTWHWGETPWVNALNEFMKTFNQANPGIEVVRDDSRYADKESVFITQSQAKAAADIAAFQLPAHPAVRRPRLPDGPDALHREGGRARSTWPSGTSRRSRSANTKGKSTACPMT